MNSEALTIFGSNMRERHGEDKMRTKKDIAIPPAGGIHNVHFFSGAHAGLFSGLLVRYPSKASLIEPAPWPA
jgi:hypothetical protein